MKTPVVFHNDYVVYLEFFDGNTFIHCDCYKWNKKVKNSLQQDVDSLVKLHRKPIIAIHEIEDKKHRKFLDIMKFTYHSDIPCTDGKVRQLFTRGL